MEAGPNLDLSRDKLLAMCKGNIKALPQFRVHDNEAWPWPDNVRIDSNRNIHMRRATFLRSVVPQVPVRAGLYGRHGIQTFYFDIRPDQLGGSAENATPVDGVRDARFIVKERANGTLPGQAEGNADHALPNPDRQQDIAADRADAKDRGRSQSVGSSVFAGVRSE